MVTPLQPELEAGILSQEYMEMVTPHQSGLRNQISMEYPELSLMGQEYHSLSVCARCSQNCSSCAWEARISMELNLTLYQELSFMGSLAVEESSDTGTKQDDF